MTKVVHTEATSMTEEAELTNLENHFQALEVAEPYPYKRDGLGLRAAKAFFFFASASLSCLLNSAGDRSLGKTEMPNRLMRASIFFFSITLPGRPPRLNTHCVRVA